MSALRPAFFILYLESYISRLNEILRHDLTLSVSEPDNAAAQIGAGTAFGVNGGQHTRAAELSTYFCVLTIRKHLLKIRFERSGRGQEPSRGHKFSILENVVLHRDFTSQTLASFPSDLVGVALVGARPLHLACARPRCRLKAPLGLSLLRCASQTRSHPKPCSSFVPYGTNGTACRAYITSPRSYRTDRRYNDQNECSIDP